MFITLNKGITLSNDSFYIEKSILSYLEKTTYCYNYEII